MPVLSNILKAVRSVLEQISTMTGREITLDLIVKLSAIVLGLALLAWCFHGGFIFVRDTVVILAAAYWGLKSICEIQEFVHRATSPPMVRLAATDVHQLYNEGRRLEMNEEIRNYLKEAFCLMRSIAEENSRFYTKWKRAKEQGIPPDMLGLDEAEKFLLSEMILGNITEESNQGVIDDLEFLSKFEAFPDSELSEQDTAELHTLFFRCLPIVRKPGKGSYVAYCNRVYHMVFSSFDPSIKKPKMSICQKYFRVPTRGEESIASLDNKDRFF